MDFCKIEGEEFSKDETEIINSMREKIFNKSLQVLDNPEISSGMSDDIELLSKYVLVNKKSEWPICYLWNFYLNGKFP